MFTHLHVHTEYSLLDGAARINKLVKKAAELGMPSLAITDHGVMYGVIDFYKACKKQGIKPIIGCEVYVAPTKLTEKNAGRDDKNYHLVLLAENMEGYRNLVKIVSKAHIDGFYYKPRTDKESLRENSKGLIALSACLAGEVSERILEDNLDKAKETALEYLSIFGEGNFFLEVQNHGLSDQLKVNAEMSKLSQITGIPLVATNDVHYVDKDDSFLQDVLLCIQTGKTLSDNNRMSFEGQEFYLKSYAEMNLLFGEHPEVLQITNEIAARCNVEFTFGTNYLPDYQVPDGFTLDQFLREKCFQVFPEIYPDAGEQERERLEYELSVITKTGYSGYFLIVADFCQYARENGVTVGPGRGSAAASMVAYLLGITAIEPIRHDLLFERFLNPDRISMPDIDIDFDPEGRDKVIKYVTQKYGSDKVCQIITFGTMGAKGAIRDVGRVLNIPLSKVDRVAKAVPNELGMTLEKALAVSPDLIKMVKEEEDVKRLLEISQGIEGMPRHASTHAAGVVIAREPLTNYLPLQRTAEGFPMTQFPMKTVEDIGLLKMDFLGLRNLTIITKTLARIEETKGIKIDLNSLPLDDHKTYQLLSEGNSSGVFQLESGGMRAILKELKPNCFEDIIAVVALYRPGPMEQIPEFIKRKQSGKISYLHPKLEKILQSTYGVIVYQEQVMQIARDLGGYSLGRADLLRRAMGKKNRDIMDEERQNFINGLLDDEEIIVPGAIRLGIRKREAEEIFDLMAKFAEYGFNKGHATAYALIAYQTAYLKANFPLEFAASLLSSVIGVSDKVSFYIHEAQSSGITVLPPDVQYSYNDFAIEGEAIRFGLGAIRNVGAQVVEKIIAERKNGAFDSFYDFVSRMDARMVNKRVMESLIKAGAFQSLCSRAQALSVLDRILDLAQNRQKDREAGQISLFDYDDKLEEDITMPELDELPQGEISKLEKEYLGLYLTNHPLSSVETLYRDFITSDIAVCLEGTEEKKVILCGIITSYRQTITKRGEMMASFVLEDLTGTIEVLVFPKIFAEVTNLQNDSIVIVKGRYYINEDEKKIFAEKITGLNEIKSEVRVNSDTKNGSIYGENIIPESPGRLMLRIAGEDNEMFGKILKLVKNFSGEIPVCIFFEGTRKLYKLSPEYNVNNSQGFYQNITALLGQNNVKWQ